MIADKNMRLKPGECCQGCACSAADGCEHVELGSISWNGLHLRGSCYGRGSGERLAVERNLKLDCLFHHNRNFFNTVNNSVATGPAFGEKGRRLSIP